MKKMLLKKIKSSKNINNNNDLSKSNDIINIKKLKKNSSSINLINKDYKKDGKKILDLTKHFHEMNRIKYKLINYNLKPKNDYFLKITKHNVKIIFTFLNLKEKISCLNINKLSRKIILKFDLHINNKLVRNEIIDKKYKLKDLLDDNCKICNIIEKKYQITHIDCIEIIGYYIYEVLFKMGEIIYNKNNLINNSNNNIDYLSEFERNCEILKNQNNLKATEEDERELTTNEENYISSTNGDNSNHPPVSSNNIINFINYKKNQINNNENNIKNTNNKEIFPKININKKIDKNSIPLFIDFSNFILNENGYEYVSYIFKISNSYIKINLSKTINYIPKLKFHKILKLAYNIRFITKLLEINLSKNNLSDNFINILFESLIYSKTNIININLSDNNISMESCNSIKNFLLKNQTIKYINFERNIIGNLGTEIISYGLKLNKSLIYLNLNYNGMKDEGIKHICNALINNSDTQLKALLLRGNYIQINGFEYLNILLKYNSTLNELDISYNNYYFNEKNNYESFNIFSYGLLSKKNNIKTLNLGGMSFDLKNIKLIISCLAKKNIIENLYFNNNNFDKEPLECLLEFMNKIKSLKVLHLCNNTFNEEQSSILYELIRNNYSLIELNLNNCFIGKNISFISEGMKVNNHLKILKLNSNLINNKTFLDFLSCLKVNNGLEILYLNNNYIGDDYIEILCKILKKIRCKIKRIYLRKNKISDESVEYFINVLNKKKKKLEFIDLNENKISQKNINKINYFLVNINI